MAKKYPPFYAPLYASLFPVYLHAHSTFPRQIFCNLPHRTKPDWLTLAALVACARMGCTYICSLFLFIGAAVESWKEKALQALFSEYPPEAIEAATALLDHWPNLFPSAFLAPPRPELPHASPFSGQASNRSSQSPGPFPSQSGMPENSDG